MIELKPEAKRGKKICSLDQLKLSIGKRFRNKYEIQKSDQEKIFAADINRQRLTIYNPLNQEKDSL